MKKIKIACNPGWYYVENDELLYIDDGIDECQVSDLTELKIWQYNELFEALAYHYPDYEKELAIVRGKVPGIDERLSEQICRFMELIRTRKLEKVPGVAETLDWARVLVTLHQDHLDPVIIEATLGIVFKNKADVQQVRESLDDFMEHLGIHFKGLSSGKEPPAFST